MLSPQGSPGQHGWVHAHSTHPALHPGAGTAAGRSSTRVPAPAPRSPPRGVCPLGSGRGAGDGLWHRSTRLPLQRGEQSTVGSGLADTSALWRPIHQLYHCMTTWAGVQMASQCPPVPPVPPGWLQAGVRGPHKARLSLRGHALIPAAALPTPGGSAASSSSSQAEKAWPTRIKCKPPQGRHAAGLGSSPRSQEGLFLGNQQNGAEPGLSAKHSASPCSSTPRSPPLFLKLNL